MNMLFIGHLPHPVYSSIYKSYDIFMLRECETYFNIVEPSRKRSRLWPMSLRCCNMPYLETMYDG